MAQYDDGTREFWVALGGCAAAIIATVLGVSFTDYKKKQLECDRMKSMPDSYWAAKKEEAIASVKIHELDIQHKERMKLDERDRAAKEAEARRAFEQSAPPEYWESLAKQKEAEERGRTERENAARQAKAIENAATQFRYALS